MIESYYGRLKKVLFFSVNFDLLTEIMIKVPWIPQYHERYLYLKKTNNIFVINQNSTMMKLLVILSIISLFHFIYILISFVSYLSVETVDYFLKYIHWLIVRLRVSTLLLAFLVLGCYFRLYFATNIFLLTPVLCLIVIPRMYTLL